MFSKLIPHHTQSVGEVSLQSLCQLLLSLSHFNFRNNLLVALVPRMASKDKKVSCTCMYTAVIGNYNHPCVYCKAYLCGYHTTYIV